jgi:hypothetical protein
MTKVQIGTSGINTQFDAKGAIAILDEILDAVSQIICFAIGKYFDNTAIEQG